MVVLNRIYTRTGDAGTTGLGNGERRPKYDRRVEAYGTVDETNATSALRGFIPPGSIPSSTPCWRGSRTTCSTSARICTPDTGAKLDYEPLRVIDAQVERLEREIDELNTSLKPLRSFGASRRQPRLGGIAPRPHGQPPRRAADGRACRDARRGRGRRCAALHEPAVRLPLRRLAHRQQQWRGGRALGARQESLSCYR